MRLNCEIQVKLVLDESTIEALITAIDEAYINGEGRIHKSDLQHSLQKYNLVVLEMIKEKIDG